MDPNEYQKQAKRTECSHTDATNIIIEQEDLAMPLLHSVIGAMGEIGELASALEKWIWYGQDLDCVNLREEWGDVNWYEAEALNALGSKFAEILQSNIDKLKKRFPDKFDYDLVKEENRDREGEFKIVEQGTLEVGTHETVVSFDLPDRRVSYTNDTREQTGSGFAEPPEEKEDGLSMAKERELKERLRWNNCSCKIIDYHFPNPTMKFSQSCQIHGAIRANASSKKEG